MDGCNADRDEMPEGYMNVSKYLNATGRPIVFSCSWPAYWNGAGKTVQKKLLKIYFSPSLSLSLSPSFYFSLSLSPLSLSLFLSFSLSLKVNYTFAGESCNLWRNYHDISVSLVK